MIKKQKVFSSKLFALSFKKFPIFTDFDYVTLVRYFNSSIISYSILYYCVIDADDFSILESLIHSHQFLQIPDIQSILLLSFGSLLLQITTRRVVDLFSIF